MNPNAVFISCDVVIDEDPLVRKHQYHPWKHHMRTNGEDPEFWFEKHLAKDFPVIPSTHLGWLREAGFVEVACYWRLYNFAITRARKPA